MAPPIKPEYQPNVSGMVVIKLVNKPFTESVEYRTYSLVKKSTRYDDDVVNELNMMTRKTSVQRKVQTVNGKDPVSITTFLQDVEAAFNPCSIHAGIAMTLFRQ